MRDVSNVNTASGVTTKVTTVNNILEARQEIQQLIDEGYLKDSLYVLAHDSERTDHIVENTKANPIGIVEEGVITAIANLFRSRGDELRAKMRSMGVSKEQAEMLESEMDYGKIVILAWGGKMYADEEYDPNISYYPYV
jgi:hypothetical protein